MDEETYFEVYWAIEHKFADGIIERRPIEEGQQNHVGRKFGNRLAVANLYNKLRKTPTETVESPKESEEVEVFKVDDLMKDLMSKRV